MPVALDVWILWKEGAREAICSLAWAREKYSLPVK